MLFARSIVLRYHSIPKINWESFLGRREEKWGSFRGRFGIISGLGIISGAVQQGGERVLNSDSADAPGHPLESNVANISCFQFF